MAKNFNEVVILSNKAQYQAFFKSRNPQNENYDQLKVFCDNPRFYEHLSSNGVKFTILNDFFIPKSQWQLINQWGTQKANELARNFEHVDKPVNYNFGRMLCSRFSYNFSHFLINYHFIKEITKQHQFKKATIFYSNNNYSFPKVPFNLLLNQLLNSFCLKNNLEIEKIVVDIEEPKYAENRIPKNRVKEILRIMVSKALNFKSRVKNKSEYLFVGSLKHLSDLIIGMKNSGKDISYLSNQPYKDHVAFCQKYSIGYVFNKMFPQPSCVDIDYRTRKIQDSLESLSSLLKRKSFFSYSDEEFDGYVDEYFFKNLNQYSKQIASEELIYEEVRQAVDPKHIILDESIARNAFLAEYFYDKNIPVTVISHANLKVNFSIPQDKCAVDNVKTIVNSKHEKVMYENRGWKSEDIHISGIPRYDQIKVGGAERKFKEKRLKVLFCAASMWLLWADKPGYAGIHKIVGGTYQKQTLDFIIDSLRDVNADLIIKPHNDEGDLWEKAISDLDYSGSIKIEKHSRDFIALLKDCDLMMLSYWSSAIIEAALLNIPTLFCDLFGFEKMAQYEKFNFFKIIKSKNDLIQSCQEISSGLANEQILKDRTENKEEFEYYFGPLDGSNLQRCMEVVESITPKQTKNPHYLQK